MTNKQHILKICPLESSFQDNKTNIKCPVANCEKTVFTSGSLRMHLSKSHGICETPGDKAFKSRTKVQPEVYTEYHCCRDSCIYNEKSERHFTTMANLKQHFMKVHAEKKFKCSKCEGGFGREMDKTRHESRCGMTFTCTTCQCTYVSKEALLTHCYRTQHPVPEEHVRKKTDKKIKSNKQGGSQNIVAVKDKCSIPVILLPVPSDSMKLTQNQLQPFISSSLDNIVTVQRSSHVVKPARPANKSKHLIDHDYQFSGDTDSCEESVKEVENDHSQKNGTRHNTVKKLVTIAPKPRSQVLNSGIQTLISVPPKEKKKSIAQTQTSGDFILKQAMACANIQIDSTSVGTQVTPKGKVKSVDMQVQVTPRSRNRKRGRNTANSLTKEKCISKRKLYGDSVSDLGVQTDILPLIRDENNIQNGTGSDLTTEMSKITRGSFASNKYLHYNQALYNSSSVQTDAIGYQRSNTKENTISQGLQCPDPQTSLGSQFPVLQDEMISTGSQFPIRQEEMVSTGSQFPIISTGSRFENGPSSECHFTSGRCISSSSMTDLFCSQTVGVQTYADFLLSQSDISNNCKSSIGINTDRTTDLIKDKLLQNKCVGNDTVFSSDSIVQTVDFDFLACSPDPQTEVMNIHTQTVDLDIESLESFVSSIETQTGTDFDNGLSSLDVQTQTQSRTSANTQTMFNTSMDFSTYPSSDIQTQTYSGFPEFIELLSSATQTLDYGFFEDAPLSLINIETQTALSNLNENNSKYSFGTQTSVFQENTIPSSRHSDFHHHTSSREDNFIRNDRNSTVNNYPSEQMEFLVSEVLEMIPVETASANVDKLYSQDGPEVSNKSKNQIVNNKYSNVYVSQDSVNYRDNECSSSTYYASTADCDIITVNNSVQTLMDSDTHTPSEKCLTSNSECQTQNFSAHNHTQTFPGSKQFWIESHTQTDMRLSPQVTISNTESHTQTSSGLLTCAAINNVDHQTQTGPALSTTTVNTDSHTQTSTGLSPQVTNNTDHQTQTGTHLSVNNTDNHTQTSLALSSQVTINNTDHQTQAGPGLSTQLCVSNTDSHTQTSAELLAQDLTNSQTQTTFQMLQNTYLTDSHTQTTWKELNDLLSELDH